MKAQTARGGRGILSVWPCSYILGELGISACRGVLRGNSFCSFFPTLLCFVLLPLLHSCFSIYLLLVVVPSYAYDNLGLGGRGFVL